MNTENNRLYQENDKRMKVAAIELMQQTDFGKITVRQICESAHVNRGTFYHHYDNIYAMLGEIEETLDVEMVAAVEEAASADPRTCSDHLPELVAYLHHVKQHGYFYRTMLTNLKSLPMKGAFQMLWNRVALPQCVRVGMSDDTELGYCRAAFQGAVALVLSQWIQEGCDTDERVLASILLRFLPAAEDAQR